VAAELMQLEAVLTASALASVAVVELVAVELVVRIDRPFYEIHRVKFCRIIFFVQRVSFCRCMRWLS
jgi:hypothetical protein